MNRRAFLGMGAAFAAAGCTAPKAGRVDAVTGATPVVPWKPFRGAGKVRVVQWGMCHEHADGKFNSLKKLPNDYELVGVIDDRASKTPREDRDFKVYKDVRIMTPEELWADKTVQCVFVEVTNDDLIPVAWQVAKHGLAMHLDKPCGQNFRKFKALMDFCQARGIPVQIGYMFRVNPAIRFATKAVKEGWLGDLVSVEADMYHDYGSKNYNAYIASFKGGIMYNLGCHLVDFILPMMPGLPRKAHVVRLPAPGDPDNAGTNCVSVLEWPHATVTIRSSRHAACPTRWLRIQGTKGAIDLRPIERFDGKPTTLELRLKEPAGGYGKGAHVVDCGIQKDRYADQLKELADIVRGRAAHPAGQYAHDVAVHQVTLMACGMPL
ncbi:MAG: Gfo/Idh/MocA family protein [Kiritimatiellia bacterium]